MSLKALDTSTVESSIISWAWARNEPLKLADIPSVSDFKPRFNHLEQG